MFASLFNTFFQSVGMEGNSVGRIHKSIFHAVFQAELAGIHADGICQIIGYQLVKIVLISPAAALATIPTITTQTVAGIVIGAVVIMVLQSSKVLSRLQRM